MKKSIYKFTNLINGKIYIGQSKNPRRRYNEHIREAKENKDNTYFHLALAKYGKDNFSFEIIEENVENYDEREMYWIAYYHSDNKKYGYNITPGGNTAIPVKGEKSILAKYSDKYVKCIISDIISGKLSYKEISDKYNISISYITELNTGRCRVIDGLTYPIKPHGNEITDKETVSNVVKALTETTNSASEIARQNNISRNTVWDINIGRNINCPKEIKYPIREKNASISNETLSKIVSDMKGNKLKFSEITEKYNISKPVINRINNGKIYKIPGEKYPLRDSSRRVY